MPNSFIQNVNTLAAKIPIIEEANTIFDEGVIPILEEIALLDLDQAVLDLRKGNYLGNRKVDINLALNMTGITEDLIEANPAAAEAIWTDPAKTVQYSSATVTFTDGVVIALPFIFDNAPTTISTHADLLAQLSRLDYVTAIAQVDTINTFVAANATSYIVTINGVPITYVSDADATIAEIVAGLVTAINLNAVPVTAASILTGTAISLTADVAGTAFNAYINTNMAITTTTANRVAGPVETAFLAKLNHTLLASFASDVVGEIVRGYDVTGQNSNLERIQLHTASGSFIDPNPIYYWAKTTSAFQTLSMRAGDIIKLGNDIDSIILLASRITEMLELQSKIPEFITNVDSLYTNIAKLVTIHAQIVGLVAIYEDIKVGGTNHIQTVSTNIASVNTNATNIVAIQNASANAATATAQAGIATTQAGIATTQAGVSTAQAVIATTQAEIATTKANEIKNVSVLSTTTGAAGTAANVIYNPVDGKFSFVVPQGVKGDKGDAFLVNAIGLSAGRSIYDAMAQGFSFLALDLSLIYFKLSATSGDWSLGAPFGKGDTGAAGAAGNGIVAIVFTSTTDISGLAGKSGATDTYTITYTNATTSTFLVYNGLNSVLINDATTTLVDTWSSTKISAELAGKVDDAQVLTNVPTGALFTDTVFDGGTITTELLATAGITITGDLALTRIDKGTVSTGTVTFTQSDGNVQRLQVGGALTIAMTGWHTTGTYSDLVLQLVNAGSATLTLPTINWIQPNGTLTTSFSTYLTAIQRPALQTSGVDFMYLFTVDGGTTVYGKLI